MPSVRNVGRSSVSTSRRQSEYSYCTAAVGLTACARFTWSAETLLKPRYRTFPGFHKLRHGSDGFFNGRGRVGVVKIPEIDCVYPQSVQTRRKRFLRISRTPVDPEGKPPSVGKSDPASAGSKTMPNLVQTNA